MADTDRASLVREAYDAFSRGEINPVLDLLDEGVEWHPPPSSLEPQALHGKQAVREYLAPDLFDEQSAEPQEILERGDRILVVARARARGRGSGARVDQTVFHLWTVDGRRAVRFEVFDDRDTALAALAGE